MKQEDVGKILATISEVPQDTTLTDVLQALIQEFDGPVGYAKQCRAVYDDAQPGGQTQQRILDLVGTLLSREASISKNTEADYSKMSDEELQMFLDAQVQEMRLDPATSAYPQSGGTDHPLEAPPEQDDRGEGGGEAGAD